MPSHPGKRRSSHTAKAGRKAVSRKISKLRDEGKSQKAAVGQALGQARQGDLGEGAKRVAGRRPSKGSTKRRGRKTPRR